MTKHTQFVSADAQPSQFGGVRGSIPVRIESDAYYAETDVADLLGISTDTLRRRRQTTSALAFCKFGRRVFYRGADIIASLESSRRLSTSDIGARRATAR